jgi:hypothetical protein
MLSDRMESVPTGLLCNYQTPLPDETHTGYAYLPLNSQGSESDCTKLGDVTNERLASVGRNRKPLADIASGIQIAAPPVYLRSRAVKMDRVHHSSGCTSVSSLSLEKESPAAREKPRSFKESLINLGKAAYFLFSFTILGRPSFF